VLWFCSFSKKEPKILALRGLLCAVVLFFLKKEPKTLALRRVFFGVILFFYKEELKLERCVDYFSIVCHFFLSKKEPEA
jgi:hypothetical protein